MALKPRYKRRILWTAVFITTVGALALVIVPPMITINSLRPKIAQAIYQQTGINAQIDGNVRFSLLGRATIVAHNVSVPMGHIDAVMFSVPIADIFNLDNASLQGRIGIHGAKLHIDSLVAPDFNNAVDIYDSVVTFHNKDYDIVRARLANGGLTGTVRTNDHKYDFEFLDDEFIIKNRNNNLEITGMLFSDGTARGHLDIDTLDINKWFEFSYPRIDVPVKLSMNFAWDGEYGFEFTDIKSDHFSGDIKILPDGAREINLTANDLDYDFTFLTNPSNIFYRTTFNLDLHGKLKLAGHEFQHLKINAIGDKKLVQISNIIADDMAITGGTIDADGAHNVLVTMPVDGIQTMCLFSGTPQNWKCSKFSYGDISGTITVDQKNFTASIAGAGEMPDAQKLIRATRRLGKNGKLDFQFSNIAGTFTITPKGVTKSYSFARNQTLRWAAPDFKYLPDFMLDAPGDMKWSDGAMAFIPRGAKWKISMTDKTFLLSGDNFKDTLPNIDLQSLNNAPYTVSGTYSGRSISNMQITVGNQTFHGSVSGRNITLRTVLLNADAFANQGYIDNYDELEFLTAAPITLPFELPVDISLTADTLIYNGNEYKNFIYALKSNTQTFSITDASRGNLLATLRKDASKYDIDIQLNKFVTNGYLLSRQMPLNVRDTMITADISLQTNGHIAHDIWYNLAGDMDLSFSGGYIVGLGVDNFYASADKINTFTFNAEYALADALTYGESVIKKMRVVGKYNNGNFITAQPFTLQMRHVDAYGEFDLDDGRMTVMLNMTMRGTAPTPAPVRLTISPDGTRNYSLTEIMTNFDSSFMRHFIKTHDKF